MSERANNFPKLHNATWPGVVGKGAPDSEPIIALDTLLEQTSKADVGVKFDGVDLWLAEPHIDRQQQDDIKRVVDHIAGFGLESARSSRRSGPMPAAARPWATPRSGRFVSGCARRPPSITDAQLSIRPTGGIRRFLDQRGGVGRRSGRQQTDRETFREAGKAAQDHSEFIVAEARSAGHAFVARESQSARSHRPGVVGFWPTWPIDAVRHGLLLSATG